MCIYSEYVEYAYIFYILKLVCVYEFCNHRIGYRIGIFTEIQV